MVKAWTVHGEKHKRVAAWLYVNHARDAESGQPMPSPSTIMESEHCSAETADRALRLLGRHHVLHQDTHGSWVAA